MSAQSLAFDTFVENYIEHVTAFSEVAQKWSCTVSINMNSGHLAVPVQVDCPHRFHDQCTVGLAHFACNVAPKTVLN